MRRRSTAVLAIRVGLITAVCAGWEVLGRESGGYFVPPLSRTLQHAWALGVSGELWPAFVQSNQSLAIGFPLSALLGVALGALLGRRRTMDQALSFYLDALLVIPIIAVIPIIIVVLGLSLAARVAVVVLFALPIIALNTRAAVLVTDADLAEMARSFGATWQRVWVSVFLPAAAGPIFTGLRLGLARAVSGMIVIELTLVPAGFGGLMDNYRASFAAADLYAVTLVVILEAILLIALAQYLEQTVNRRLRGLRA